MIPVRGYVFIGLNVVRILSIVALFLVFSSSIFVMVQDIKAVNTFVAQGGKSGPDTDSDYILNSTVPNQPAGQFWAVLNRLLIIAQTIVLLFSELGCFSGFFQKFFPILADDFGLGPIGIIQCLIGAAVLSHHVEPFSLVSAWFLFSIGCLNMLIGLIWRSSARAKRSVTSWRESKEDVLPKNVKSYHSPRPSTTPPSFHSTQRSEKTGLYDADTAPAIKWAGYGFGRQGEKAAAARGFLITKPIEALPRYAPKQSPGRS
jgi:hypothetical protein